MEERFRSYRLGYIQSIIPDAPPELPTGIFVPLVAEDHLVTRTAARVIQCKRLQQAVIWLVPEINKIAPELTDAEKSLFATEFANGFFDLDYQTQKTPLRHRITMRIGGNKWDFTHARVYHWILETLYPLHGDIKTTRRVLLQLMVKQGTTPLKAPHMPEAYSLVRTNLAPISSREEFENSEMDVVVPARETRLAELRRQQPVQSIEPQSPAETCIKTPVGFKRRSLDPMLPEIGIETSPCTRALRWSTPRANIPSSPKATVNPKDLFLAPIEEPELYEEEEEVEEIAISPTPPGSEESLPNEAFFQMFGYPHKDEDEDEDEKGADPESPPPRDSDMTYVEESEAEA